MGAPSDCLRDARRRRRGGGLLLAPRVSRSRTTTRAPTSSSRGASSTASMPGWQQIGAVWLPLPHVLNMLPVQVDAWYRTGASAIAISVAAMAVGAWALASLDHRTHRIDRRRPRRRRAAPGQPERALPAEHADDRAAALRHDAARGALTAEWVDRGAPGWPRAAGLALAAACMTRYEAWPICGSAGRAGAGGAPARGTCPRGVRHCVARLSSYPAMALVLFLAQQPVDGRRVVHQQRILRRRERSAGPAARRLGAGARGRLSPVRPAVVWPAYAARPWSSWSFVRARARAPRWRSSSRSPLPRRCRGTRTSKAIRSASATACRSSSPARRSSARASACCRAACARSRPRSRSRRALWQVSPLDRSARGHRRIATRRAEPRRTTGRHRIPRVAPRRPTDHDEHGIARALHARPVARGLRGARLPARRATAKCGRRRCSTDRAGS